MKTYQQWTKPQNNWMGEVNWLWVFTKYGQGMIKIDSKKCYEKWSLKSQGLMVQVSNLKRDDNVCTTSQSFKSQQVKRFRTKRLWIMECKTS